MARVTDLTALIGSADTALVRTVDGLADTAYAEPSVLPGWTRAHVVAHVTLNAEALAGVLHGAHLGDVPPMYASNEARDADIDALAAAEPSEVRDRFLASTSRFADALAAMHEGDWEGRFDRTPGGREIRVSAIPLMRLRELEIHHADLDAGYTAADWPEAFRRVLLDSLKSFPSSPFEARPTDLDGTWSYGSGDGEGDGGPVVSGTSAAIGWWLTGRGSGEGVTSSTNELPEVEAW